MSVAAAIGWGLAMILFGVSFWIRRQRRVRNPFTTRASKPIQSEAIAVMPNASEALVYVENDGSARELTTAEKKYVDTEFSPFDGSRPYVKESYEARNGWGELIGYLPRDQLPPGIAVDPAPTDIPEPKTPEAIADSLLETARKYRPAEAHKLRFRVPPSSD